MGLDGLTSSAYGPEAALTILLPLGAAGLAYIGPITLVILALLAMLYFPTARPSPPTPSTAGRTRWPRRTWARGPACWRRRR